MQRVAVAQGAGYNVQAVATANRYDAVATFDRKVANKLEGFGLESYF